MELRHNLCMTLVPYATLWYAFFLEIAIFRIFGVQTPFKITGLNRRRVHESVADQIRQAIFGGVLAPGHKLPPDVKWLSALRQAALPCVKLSVPSNRRA